MGTTRHTLNEARRGWLTAVTVTMMIAGVLAFAGAGTPAGAYQTAVHPQIAQDATDLYANQEILDHLAWIKDGAVHEDELDHVWDFAGILECTVTATHFWNADLGPNDPAFCWNGDKPNAWQEAAILWGMSLGHYENGDRGTAYEYLGHVAHLLMDMAVPTHAHEDQHPFSDDYEDWLGTGEAALTQGERDALIALGPVELPGGPVDPLYQLFYMVNQVGGFYASEDYNGNSEDPEGWAEFHLLADVAACRNMDDWVSGCRDVVRENNHFYAIRAVATLYQLFEAATNRADLLTVVIDEIQELECHDDAPGWCESGPDFFVRIQIGDFWFRNEGNQIEDTAHITPGWAFARPAGISGQVGVTIQVWDEDEDPNDDDPSDIDPVDGATDLNLIVDLAKCITFEAGGVGGELSGACGQTLTSAGTESDRSRVWFRILPPNAPPEADTGPDQTVDENDLVTLNGTFTDPNPEDTHTFLWHLESSTNGQAISDATTENLSFVALDNGTYTFLFTVTDNHGATGSDVVVVTALNVPPVPSIDHLTDETGAEIGVDVPVALVGLEVDLAGSFTDVGTLDTHTATLVWGDGTQQAESEFSSFTGSLGGVVGTLASSHVYSVDGLYTITLWVTDKDAGVGADFTQIEIVDAADAVAIVAETLAPFADDPLVQHAIDKLIGENGGDAAGGAFDLLEKGNLNAALEKVKQALGYLEAAEADDPGLDFTFEKGLLTLAAKSVTLGAITEAEAVATKPSALTKVQQAKDLVALGDGLLAGGDYVGAVGGYQEAVRKVQGIS